MGDNSGGFSGPHGPTKLAAKESILKRRGYWRILELGSLSFARRNANVARCKLCHDTFEPSGPKLPLLLHCGDSACLECVREAAHSDELHVKCPADGKLTTVNRDQEVFGLVRNMTVIEMLDKTAAGQTQRHLIDSKPEANDNQEGKPTIQQEHLPDPPSELNGGGDKPKKGIPAEEFFTDGNDDANEDHAQEIHKGNIKCDNVDTINVWWTVKESTEAKEAQKLWRRIQKERTMLTKEYHRQKAKLQEELKAVVESLNEEHDRQTTELQQKIAELQTSLDNLNASFSEQMKSINGRSSNRMPSVDDDLTPTDEVGRTMPLKTSPRSMYQCGLKILQEQEESLAKQDDLDSDLVAKMNHCLGQQDNNISGLGQSKTESCNERVDYQELRESYLKQKEIYNQLRLHYDQEKREHHQAAVRYELRLSARDDLILAQDSERLRLLEKVQEQSRQIRQYSDMSQCRNERIPERQTESDLSAHPDGVQGIETVKQRDSEFASEALDEPESGDNTIPKVAYTICPPGPVLRTPARLSKLSLSLEVGEEETKPESIDEAKTEDQPLEMDRHVHSRCEDMTEAETNQGLAPVLAVMPAADKTALDPHETDYTRMSGLNEKDLEEQTGQTDQLFHVDLVENVDSTLESQPCVRMKKSTEDITVQIPTVTSELLKPSSSSQEAEDMTMTKEAVEKEDNCQFDTTEIFFKQGTQFQGINSNSTGHGDPSESGSKQVSKSTSITGQDEESSRLSEAGFSITSRLSEYDSEDNASTVDDDTTAPGAEGIAMHLEGMLRRKHELEAAKKKASIRSWFKLFTVIHSKQMSFYKDRKHAKADPEVYPRHAHPLDLSGASATVASDYVKRDHVFRLKLSSGATYLFHCKTDEDMKMWIEIINTKLNTGHGQLL